MIAADLHRFGQHLNELVDKLTAPHVLFRPAILVHRGKFYAYYAAAYIDVNGDDAKFPGAAAVGTGATPAEACLAFDRAWRQLP